MCRYLHYVREATMTAPAEEHRTVPVVEVLFSPMYAAIYYNQPEVAKWLAVLSWSDEKCFCIPQLQ